jgi:hypothetical protein
MYMHSSKKIMMKSSSSSEAMLVMQNRIESCLAILCGFELYKGSWRLKRVVKSSEKGNFGIPPGLQ